MIRVGRLATLLTTVTLLAGAHGAHANDPDLRATTVPAAECLPVSSSDASRVNLANGAWIFNGTTTGTVTFNCPLPINGNTEFDASNTNDMTAYRVFYQDSDGMGAAAEVTVRVFFRTPSYFPFGPTWTSNSSAATASTTAFQPLVHNLFPSVLYTFVVTLSRTSTDQKAVFYGIDFP